MQRTLDEKSELGSGYWCNIYGWSLGKHIAKFYFLHDKVEIRPTLIAKVKIKSEYVVNVLWNTVVP